MSGWTQKRRVIYYSDDNSSTVRRIEVEIELGQDHQYQEEDIKLGLGRRKKNRK